MKEILRKLKEEISFDSTIEVSEAEVDGILLRAINELKKDPELVVFKEGKFECSEEAPIEIKFYVYYRNKKYKYWQDLDLGIPDRDNEYMTDEEWDEWHRDKAIEKYGEELLVKEENKDLITIKDEYYSCKLEAPYEVYFYVESKNINTYFIKVVIPRRRIERIKEARIKSGYTFYEDYTNDELSKFPYVEPELIKVLVKEHGFNPLVWNGQSWINCFEIYKN